jgi:hypothetical protein
MIITVEEIRDLARAAGLTVDDTCMGQDEMETELVVCACPKDGLLDESSGVHEHYRVAAYFYDCPDEGFFGLGKATERK